MVCTKSEKANIKQGQTNYGHMATKSTEKNHLISLLKERQGKKKQKKQQKKKQIPLGHVIVDWGSLYDCGLHGAGFI